MPTIFLVVRTILYCHSRENLESRHQNSECYSPDSASSNVTPCLTRGRNDRNDIITIFCYSNNFLCHSRESGNPDLITSKETILIVPTFYKDHPN